MVRTIPVKDYNKQDGTYVSQHTRDIQDLNNFEVLTPEWEAKMKELQEEIKNNEKEEKDLDKLITDLLRQKKIDEKTLMRKINDYKQDSRTELADLSENVDKLSVDQREKTKELNIIKTENQKVQKAVKQQKKRAKSKIKRESAKKRQIVKNL